MKTTLAPADRIVILYYGIIAAVTLASAPQVRHLAVHLGWCATAIALVVTISRLAARGGSAWNALHDWVPVFCVLGAFQQLAWLIPDVHPFTDHRFDWALARLDERWFGDVRGFLRTFTVPWLSDLMSLCYWTYYPMPILLAGALWWKGETARFREIAAVLLTAWFLSYLGYIAVPAVGPHHVIDGARDAALGGGWVAGTLHRWLMSMEGTMADAFPSGHTLIAVVCSLLAWKHHRQLFWVILPAATGLVVATMYLRYHYVVDVAGGLALVPVSIVLGRAMVQWTGAAAVPLPAKF